MKLRDYTLEILAAMVVGDHRHFPYRSSSFITLVFQRCDLDYVHDGSTRKWWAKDVQYLITWRVSARSRMMLSTPTRGHNIARMTVGTTSLVVSARQFEFYDYTNLGNREELGNDFTSTNPAPQALLTGMQNAFFSAAVQNELGGTLAGVYHTLARIRTLSFLTSRATPLRRILLMLRTWLVRKAARLVPMANANCAHV